MGQKVHPTGMRLGIVKQHTSIWYAQGPAYAKNLHADLEVRAFIHKKLAQASVSRIDIHRPAQTARITIHTARPGIVIGKKGEDVEALRQEIGRMMKVPESVFFREAPFREKYGFLMLWSTAMSKAISLPANRSN